MIKKVKICFVLALAVVLGGVAFAQKPASEYEIKAAFVYNFIKFVEWPTNAFPEKDAPFTIGVLGENDPFFDSDALTNYLDQSVRGKTINERKLVVRRNDHIANLKNCQLIFIARSEKGRLSEIFSSLDDAPILTIGDTEGFCRQGGMINFIRQSGKVRFEINLAGAEKAGLKISSKLLNVATLVQTQNR